MQFFFTEIERAMYSFNKSTNNQTKQNKSNKQAKKKIAKTILKNKRTAGDITIPILSCTSELQELKQDDIGIKTDTLIIGIKLNTQI